MTQIRPIIAVLSATLLAACSESSKDASATNTSGQSASAAGARSNAKSDGSFAIGVGATPGKPGYDGVTRGIQLAIERLNTDAGGSVRFSMVTPAAATSTVQIAQGLRDNPSVIAVVGHPESGTTLEAIPVYADAEHENANAVVAVSPTASSPGLTGISRWFFRVAPSDNEAARLVARYVADSLKAKTVAIVYRNDSYGRDWSARFSETFTGGAHLNGAGANGNSANSATAGSGSANDAGANITDKGGTGAGNTGKVLARIPYLTGITEWKAYALQLKRLAPEVLLFPGDADDAAEMLRELKANDVKLTFIGGDGTEGLARTHEFPEAKYAAFFLPERATTPEGKRFVDSYRARFNEAPDMFAALSYDAALAIGHTVIAGARTRNEVRERLGQITDASGLEGAGGRIAFNAQHDITGRTIVIATVGTGDSKGATPSKAGAK